jgi:phthalate 4,5-dioxygenase reductase subunit
MAMMRSLNATPAKQYKLYYCTRSPDFTAFREELSGPEFEGKVIIHHDDGDPARALDIWPSWKSAKIARIFIVAARGR